MGTPCICHTRHPLPPVTQRSLVVTLTAPGMSLEQDTCVASTKVLRPSVQISGFHRRSVHKNLRGDIGTESEHCCAFMPPPPWSRLQDAGELFIPEHCQWLQIAHIWCASMKLTGVSYVTCARCPVYTQLLSFYQLTMDNHYGQALVRMREHWKCVAICI